MIRIEAVQLRRLAADVLRQLNVADSVEVMDVRELTDGAWMVGFADGLPDTRFPGFEIGIQQDWSPEEAAHELRLELRDKLWICPLCQRRSQIRRIIDRETFRVECGRCGRFEIENGLLDQFRLAFEADDRSLVDHLSRLSETSDERAVCRFYPRTIGVPSPTERADGSDTVIQSGRLT